MSDTKEKEDVLYEEKPDRRLLSYVPDASGQRSNHDRRGGFEGQEAEDYTAYQREDKAGQRYLVDYAVDMTIEGGGSLHGTAVDISTTGLLVKFPIWEKVPQIGDKAKLTFEITPGSMPEGYEMKIKKLKARCVRVVEKEREMLVNDLTNSFDNKMTCKVVVVSSIERTKIGKQKRLIQKLDLSKY